MPRDRSGKPRPAPRASRQARKAVGRRRLRLVAGAVVLVCISLGGRAVHLSVESDGRFAAAFASEQRLVATAEDRSERGAILSADGRRLAASLDAAEVVATPYQIEDARANATALAGVLDLETTQIEAKLTKRDGGGAPGGYSVVASGVEPERARQVRDLSIPGVTVTPDAVRVYPNGALASQLLGHLGVQFANKLGFETVAIARGADKAEMATRLGAHHYIDSNGGDVAGELQALGGARVVLATAANSAAMSATVGSIPPKPGCSPIQRVA